MTPQNVPGWSTRRPGPARLWAGGGAAGAKAGRRPASRQPRREGRAARGAGNVRGHRAGPGPHVSPSFRRGRRSVRGDGPRSVPIRFDGRLARIGPRRSCRPIRGRDTSVPGTPHRWDASFPGRANGARRRFGCAVTSAIFPIRTARRHGVPASRRPHGEARATKDPRARRPASPRRTGAAGRAPPGGGRPPPGERVRHADPRRRGPGPGRGLRGLPATCRCRPRRRSCRRPARRWGRRPSSAPLPGTG